MNALHPPSPSWVRRWPATESSRIRLLGLPHAGGGPAAFQGWRSLLPDDVDLLVAHLPGRETRLREAPPTDIERVLRELETAVGPGAPVVLFGHSWGAHLALQLARRLDGVRHLVVSGSGAPHCPRRMAPIAHLPRQEFLAALDALGGIPKPVLAHVELMDALLPALRADFRLAEKSAVRPVQPPLACPITAFGGSRDPLTTDDSLAAWSMYTSSTFHRVTFSGDHFFHLTQRDDVVAAVVRLVNERTAA